MAETAAETPAPAKRESSFRTQNIGIRWHKDVNPQLDVVAGLEAWAKKNGHLIQVRETARGKVVRIGGTERTGQLMSKEMRERVRAAGLSKDELEKLLEAELQRRASAAK
jgi:hypothetical protein